MNFPTHIEQKLLGSAETVHLGFHTISFYQPRLHKYEIKQDTPREHTH